MGLGFLTTTFGTFIEKSFYLRPAHLPDIVSSVPCGPQKSPFQFHREYPAYARPETHTWYLKMSMMVLRLKYTAVQLITSIIISGEDTFRNMEMYS